MLRKVIASRHSVACALCALAIAPLTAGAASHRMPTSGWGVPSPVRTLANHSRKLEVLYTFLGKPDGDGPDPDLAMDASGALYGVAAGGSAGYGVVYKLAPSGSSYHESILYDFHGGLDGQWPSGKLLIGARGGIFGTTQLGGGSSGGGCGTVYKLTPSRGAYHKTTIFSFAGCGSMGATPDSGVVTDKTGALYGTTMQGGASGIGVVFKLTPKGLQYTESVLHSFTGGSDAGTPAGTLVEGSDGSLYGTAAGGDANLGVAYEMAKTGSTYQEKIVHTFHGGNDGASPSGPLILDASGTLYGTTHSGGSQGGGTVFALTPFSGGYSERILCAFSPSFSFDLAGGVVMDVSGDLFGATEAGGQLGWGTIYELLHEGTRYVLRTLYGFQGQADGGDPQSTLVMDARGALYGTTARGQRLTHGNVFRLTP